MLGWLFRPRKKTTAKRFILDDSLFDDLDDETRSEYYYMEREQERDELNFDCELAAERYDDDY